MCSERRDTMIIDVTGKFDAAMVRNSAPRLARSESVMTEFGKEMRRRMRHFLEEKFAEPSEV